MNKFLRIWKSFRRDPPICVRVSTSRTTQKDQEQKKSGNYLCTVTGETPSQNHHNVSRRLPTFPYQSFAFPYAYVASLPNTSGTLQAQSGQIFPVIPAPGQLAALVPCVHQWRCAHAQHCPVLVPPVFMGFCTSEIRDSLGSGQLAA